MIIWKRLAVVLAATLAAPAAAAVTFNEIGFDMPGGDDGEEFIELRGTPGESLDGLSYITVESDSGGNAGSVEQVIRLDGLAIGSNGLLLIRDGSAAQLPAPAVGTTVVVRSTQLTKDLENDSNNHLLVRNLAAGVAPQNDGLNATTATDVDANDDGLLDAGFFDGVVDGFTIIDNVNDNVSYVASPADRSPIVAGFTPDSAFRLTDGRWVAAVGTTASPEGGPYTLVGTELRLFGTGEVLGAASLDNPQLTPGNANPSLVPEPASLAAIAGVAGLTLARRRRRD